MTDRESLRLATWNIHMGVGLDGQRDIQRVGQVIGEITPDVIGLQEVDNRPGQNGDDLQQLGHHTGLEIVSGPTMQRSTGDYGNALLTRLPILKVERHDISFKKREPRGLLIVHLDWNGETIQIAVTHLGLKAGERRHQVQHLIDFLDQPGRFPLVLMGDFNEWLFLGRPMRWLRRHFGRWQSPRSFPSKRPLLRLDHILADPPTRLNRPALHNSPLAKTASDHLPLVAYFQ